MSEDVGGLLIFISLDGPKAHEIPWAGILNRALGISLLKDSL